MAAIPDDYPSAAPIAAYLDDYFAMHPYLAVKAGLHQFDGFAADWSSAGIARRLEGLRRFQAELGAIASQPMQSHRVLGDMPRLGAEDELRWDARLALAQVRSERFFWEIWRPHETNPLTYVPLLDVSIYVKRNYAPLAERVRAIIRHCAAIPDILAAARAHLVKRLPLPLLQQSVATFESLAHFHTGTLIGAVQPVGDSALLASFQKANRAAASAYRAFTNELRSLAPHTTDELAIGGEILRGMLSTGELVDLPLERLLAMGEADLARNHDRMLEVAGRMGKTPAEAMAELGRRHPPVEAVLAQTRALCEEIREFLIAHEIVTVPGERRCQVAETQPYMRNGSAFMDVPGPFERAGTEAYFYLTLPDPAWSAAQQEAWMAKHSIPGLANTCIHEAWPGHFLQYLHLLNAPTPVSKLFTSTSFIEGWAHYVEQLMIEQGYGADDPHFELQQLSMALLRDCRFLVALRLHTGQMSVDEATEFIMREAFFTPIRAQQEAMRGARSPGYLNYTLGKLLFLRLRAELQRAHPTWSVRQLHDAMLAFGAPPVPLLREALLGVSPNSMMLV